MLGAGERAGAGLDSAKKLREVWLETMVFVLSFQAETKEKRERILRMRGRKMKVLEENAVSERYRKNEKK